MPSREPLVCIVAGGGDVDALGPALTALDPPLSDAAVVLVRLRQPTPVSAAVVHAVVDQLRHRGCDPVVVGSSISSYDRDRGHRSVSELARQAGLGGRTPAGAAYDVVDLGADLVGAPVPGTSVLSGRLVSRCWVESPTRVVVGRAVTDLTEGYAACLRTLLGAAPEVAGADPADVGADLLTHLPPTLAVVDALAASVGPDGGRLPQPLDSRALVVATDLLAADSATAALLGLDRSAAPLFERALLAVGPPTGRTEGRLASLDGAHAAHPLARAAAGSVAAEPRLARVLSAATGGPDDAAEPGDPVLTTLRDLLTPLVVAADDPAGHLPLTAVLGAVGAARLGALGWSTTFDKDTVDRREVPLGFDPAAYPVDRYDGLPAFFAPFDALVEELPENADGMRWRLVDGATVFEVARDVRADFDQWVARVDVAAGISLMADYLGGRRVTVSSTARGGTTRTRQAERNLYLPQPNYLATWGGEPIDVCKIELVERSTDTHRLTWRTVSSPNGSADYDDGSLTFSRTPGGTRVVVRGRQLFALPDSWSGVDLASVPELRNPLLEEAYRRFFTTTFDNLEACFEGREFRIGRPPMDPAEPLLTRALDLVLGAVSDWAVDQRASASQAESAGGTRDSGTELDAHGFRHVRGPR
ncbi:protein of unknown function [Pedococcus dokdonensis]|uniref:DUF362 domain-containing protein n=1 Tax=Pedococcus dokdonensis TaxID=443156 RepID=A0A1H0UH95_9MICO|nr:protein of unknown function [Pedococcus dokdonensis]